MVEAGGLLMRGAWNSGLYGELNDVYEEGKRLDSKPDVWIHKNRMSALWGGRTELETFLEEEGIRSLLFTGVNTDQCVGGTLQDGFSKGYDCVLLGDGAGTSSPSFAQECMEYNAQKSWGFMSSCEGFAKGVEEMISKA
jgi:nicotinamidase-related amidase